MSKKFTPALIKKIAPRGRSKVTSGLDDLLNEMLPKYGITKPKRVALFIANTLVETGEWRALEENLNYSAKRLRQVWPSRFKTAAHAQKYAHRPEKLANYVYNRYGNKGKRGYGWKYRGRSFMQTTFVDNYQDVEDVTGMPVVANPDLLARPREALEAACIYWKQKGCNELADADRITDCRRIINGGTHGLRDVKRYYRKVLPLVRDLDLNNNLTKTVAYGGATAAASTTTGNEWVILIVAGVVIVGLIGVIAWQRYRRHKDVQEAIAEIRRMEDESSPSVLDSVHDDSVHNPGGPKNLLGAAD